MGWKLYEKLPHKILAIDMFFLSSEIMEKKRRALAHIEAGDEPSS